MISDYLPADISRRIGRWRRRRGRYDARTAACLRRAAKRESSPEALLEYLRFRRDLGHLPAADEAENLLHLLPALTAARRRNAVNLLLECGFEDAVLGAVPSAELTAFATHSPPVAHLLGHHAQLTGTARHLARLHASQDAWRRDFTAELRDRAGCGVRVIGNAGHPTARTRADHGGEGAWITRFNRFNRATPADEGGGADTGLDVWVRAPDLDEPVPHPGPTWVVLSGADPRFQLGTWGAITDLLERDLRVVTIPLCTWRSLVAELSAPPSAGLLYLAWVIEVLGKPDAVTAAGFQALDEVGASTPRRRGQGVRHDWSAERRVLAGWRRNGLRVV